MSPGTLKKYSDTYCKGTKYGSPNNMISYATAEKECRFDNKNCVAVYNRGCKQENGKDPIYKLCKAGSTTKSSENSCIYGSEYFHYIYYNYSIYYNH